MSIVQWSTPERRAGDKDLPIIPNEIYLIIFEHIAPTSMRLFSEQLKTFSNLSRVCRFFCNTCLPRIFEDLKIHIDAVYMHSFSRAQILCQQIAAKQPLALSLAQCVKVCRFEDWKLFSEGSRAAQALYISGISHMKNIRELSFSQNTMKNAHWDMIASVQSLEDLTFTYCQFVDSPADVDPGKRLNLKVKVPRVGITMCSGVAWLTAAIDARHLRTLTIDFQSAADQVDWLSETSIIEICLKNTHKLAHVKYILGKMPQSIQVLMLPVYTPDTDLFGDPLWKNIPLLRSLTVEAMEQFPGMTAVRIICEGIRVHKGLQSFTFKAWVHHKNLVVSAAEVRHMVQEQLSNLSELDFVDIYGTAVGLVDGKWIDVTK
ncbi:hypothetical protein PAXINDRAFT_8531 [Paxillus involutus ATCC 200175]|nr:hypothetical protein PAXINDRAFT_8531 [Paxillus involutus ATCC 200175]